MAKHKKSAVKHAILGATLLLLVATVGPAMAQFGPMPGPGFDPGSAGGPMDMGPGGPGGFPGGPGFPGGSGFPCDGPGDFGGAPLFEMFKQRGLGLMTVFKAIGDADCFINEISMLEERWEDSDLEVEFPLASYQTDIEGKFDVLEDLAEQLAEFDEEEMDESVLKDLKKQAKAAAKELKTSVKSAKKALKLAKKDLTRLEKERRKKQREEFKKEREEEMERMKNSAPQPPNMPGYMPPPGGPQGGPQGGPNPGFNPGPGFGPQGQEPTIPCGSLGGATVTVSECNRADAEKGFRPGMPPQGGWTGGPGPQGNWAPQGGSNMTPPPPPGGYMPPAGDMGGGYMPPPPTGDMTAPMPPPPTGAMGGMNPLPSP